MTWSTGTSMNSWTLWTIPSEEKVSRINGMGLPCSTRWNPTSSPQRGVPTVLVWWTCCLQKKTKHWSLYTYPTVVILFTSDTTGPITLFPRDPCPLLLIPSPAPRRSAGLPPPQYIDRIYRYISIWKVWEQYRSIELKRSQTNYITLAETPQEITWTRWSRLVR